MSSLAALADARTPEELRAAAVDLCLDLSVALVHALGQFEFPAWQRIKLQSALGPSVTVGDVLSPSQKKLRKKLTQIFGLEVWFALIKDWAQIQADPGLPRRRKSPDIAHFQIPDLDTWDFSVIDPRTPPGTSVRDAVERAPLHDLSLALIQFEARLSVARAHLKLRALRPPRPTGSEVLDRLLVAVRPLEEALRLTYPPDIVGAQTSLRTTGTGVEFQVRWAGATAPTLLRWPCEDQTFELSALRCECGREVCVHRAAVLHRLLTGETFSLAESFTAALIPGWERALAEMEAPPPAPLPDPAVLNVGFFSNRLEFSFSKLTVSGAPSRQKTRVFHLANDFHRFSGQAAEIARAHLMNAAERHGGDVALACVGYTRVFWEQEPEPVPCELAAPQVAFIETAAGVEARVSLGERPYRPVESGGQPSVKGLVVPVREPSRLALYLVPPEVLRLATAIDRHGAEFPKEALPRLSQQLVGLEAVTEVRLPDDMKGDERPPADEVVAQVRCGDGTYSLALRAEPLAGGALFTPGGGSPIAAAFDGQRRAWTRRVLEAELAHAGQVMAQLELPPSPDFAWKLETGEHAIEVLRRVHQRSTEGLRVEWPSRRPRFTPPAKIQNLGLSVGRQQDWFDLEGQATIDGRRVALAELLEAARARRHWVQVGDDDFVQLSKALLDALTPLAHLGDPNQPTVLTLGAVPLIEALAAQLDDFTAVTGWTSLVSRLQAAQHKHFEVPDTVATPLRDYQREGFIWLCRLADWGAGAVLADDMGLGKTLQALALLAARGPLGPALVVAPSSVLHTWRTEAARHVPSALKLSLFHESDRELAKLGPNQVIVVSWSMLAREIARIEKTRFATVIFDEAHAMKNADTLRAKAAHRLDGQFKVALSGTPVENHVGELWSLFRGVLPSLLGSQDSFDRRFATGSPAALAALSALVRPFLLRRTKVLVAKELPPRTELDVVVPLSDQERALYEDLRLSMLQEFGTQTGASARFEVLAALTRLRLSACHPALVDPGWKGPTSKLDRLLELLRDLTNSDHRVLVFSQFTVHLALVQQALKKEGMAFSYLDGTLSPDQRQERVERFQAGQGGDVFLISLKAGGTGLTLTAADYVIHLDPWWNPAVEDQASDRAHRLGQTRPVTVYRLIAQGTVEEKMLSLHRDKRAMVDALLAGTEAATKWSAADLLGLLSQGAEPRTHP